MPNIRQIRRTPYHLGHQRSRHLLSKHELFQCLGNCLPRCELTYEVHSPGRMSDVTFVSNIRFEGVDTSFDDEGLHFLMTVRVGEGGKVLGFFLG